jgi:hypothetical protein
MYSHLTIFGFPDALVIQLAANGILSCEYWMSSSVVDDKGIHFNDGFRSEDLSRTLEFIKQHQLSFSPSPNLGRTGLLQIERPTPY